MDDKSLRKVESMTATGAEMVASLIPGVGGPLAILINRAAAARSEDITKKLIEELRCEFEEAYAKGWITNPVEALSSEEFITNARFVIRTSQETSDLDRRKRLRRALVQGARSKWRNDAELFTRIAARLEEDHMVVLRILHDLTDRKMRLLPNGVSCVQRQMNEENAPRRDPVSYVRSLALQLQAERLLRLDSQTILPEEKDDEGASTGFFGTIPQLDESLKLTNRGVQFIRFISVDESDDVPDEPDHQG